MQIDLYTLRIEIEPDACAKAGNDSRAGIQVAEPGKCAGSDKPPEWRFGQRAFTKQMSVKDGLVAKVRVEAKHASPEAGYVGFGCEAAGLSGLCAYADGAGRTLCQERSGEKGKAAAEKQRHQKDTHRHGPVLLSVLVGGTHCIKHIGLQVVGLVERKATGEHQAYIAALAGRFKASFLFGRFGDDLRHLNGMAVFA